MKRIFYALAIVLLFSGAATSKEKIKTFKDPDAPDLTYKKIFVDFQNTDYESRVKGENDIRGMLEKKGFVDVLVGHEFFFPTRQYSEEQKESIISEAGADAELKIILAQRDISKTIQVNQTVTQQGAVVSSSTPVIATSDLWNAHLKDRSLKRDVWFGSFWDRKFAKEVVAELLKSGFIGKRDVTPNQSRYSR